MGSRVRSGDEAALGRASAAPSDSDGGGATAAALAEARRRLADPAAAGVPLGRLLGGLGVTYDALRRTFARVYGQTPGQYRARCRAGRAGDLLAAGRSVAETADALGYPDAFTFSRQFRRQIGRPPSHYRR